MDDRDRFARLYDENVDAIYSYARNRLGATEAEDLTAEVFHAALLARRRGGLDDLTSAWLMAVARNKVIDRWRMRGRRSEKVHLLGRADHSLPPDWVEDPRAEEVMVALERLSDRHRTLLIMCHVNGSPIRDVAAELGETESAIESALKRARQSFRDVYEGSRGV